MTSTNFRAGRLSAAILATALAFALAACSSGGTTPSAVPSAVSSVAASAGAIDLNGTTWLLTDYISPDGASYTVPGAVTPTAAFDGGTMSGSAGCNTFSAPYTIEGDTISFGPAVSTKMACEEPMATVEGAYLLALSVVDRVAFLDDGKLQLWDSEGKTTLAFLKGN